MRPGVGVSTTPARPQALVLLHIRWQRLDEDEIRRVEGHAPSSWTGKQNRLLQRLRDAAILCSGYTTFGYMQGEKAPTGRPGGQKRLVVGTTHPLPEVEEGWVSHCTQILVYLSRNILPPSRRLACRSRVPSPVPDSTKWRPL